MTQAAQRVRERLARTMTKAVAEYELLEAGAYVLVSMSGGKDS